MNKPSKEELKEYEQLMKNRVLSNDDYTKYLINKSRFKKHYYDIKTNGLLLSFSNNLYYMPEYSDMLLFEITPGIARDVSREINSLDLFLRGNN